MESTHHGFVSCPLARETNQGLTALDPNPGTRLKKNQGTLLGNTLLVYIPASVLFMYLYTPPLLPLKTSLAYCQTSAFNAVILEFSPVWLQMSEPTFLVA